MRSLRSSFRFAEFCVSLFSIFSVTGLDDIRDLACLRALEMQNHRWIFCFCMQKSFILGASSEFDLRQFHSCELLHVSNLVTEYNKSFGCCSCKRILFLSVFRTLKAS